MAPGSQPALKGFARPGHTFLVFTGRHRSVASRVGSASTPSSPPPPPHTGTDVDVVEGACVSTASCQAAIDAAVDAAVDVAVQAADNNAVLESPLFWLGFSPSIPGSKIFGPSGDPAGRGIELAGRGLEQLNYPQLQDLFTCIYVSSNGTGTATHGGVVGIASADDGKVFVPCTVPDLAALGTYELQLAYRGGGTSVLVPFRGGANGNRFSITRGYVAASAPAAGTGDVVIRGVGFDSTQNVTCAFATATVPATRISVSRRPSSTTELNCGPVPAGRLDLGAGMNVRIIVSLDTDHPFLGDAGANSLVIPDTCADGLQDGTETDVDCGGANAGRQTQCPRCAETRACRSSSDCAEEADCDSDSNVCTTPSDGLPRARAGSPAVHITSAARFESPARKLLRGSGASFDTNAPASLLNHFAVGDSVLVICLYASGNGLLMQGFNLTAVGMYEYARIGTIDGTNVVFTRALTNDYEIGNTRHTVVMQKVQEYDTLSVDAVWRASPLNLDTVGNPEQRGGGDTGIIVFTVRNTLTVRSQINADFAGYWGGVCNNFNDGGSGGAGGQGRAGYSLGSTGTNVVGNCRQAGGGGGGAVSLSSCAGRGSTAGGSGGGGGDNAPGGGGGHGTGGRGGGNGDCE